MKQLYFGDNLDIMKKLLAQHPQGFIDLIYIDPPFNSKRNYNVLFESLDMTDTKAQKEAFSDTWSSVSYHDTLNEIQNVNLDVFKFITALDAIKISKSAISYLTIMAIRIIYMHKLLKDTGSFYLHCDPTMSHYLKILCDFIFGSSNFQNEIVWCYKRWTATANKYQSIHDIILFYTKSSEFTFNTQYEPYGDWIKNDYKYVDEETGKRWRWHTVKGVRYKVILEDENKGVKIGDWWEINPLGSTAKERLGYPTQKPLALMERIVKASSNEGDLIGDFFCGCGTTIAAAEKLNRNWIGTDISHLAIKLIKDRLTSPYPEDKRIEILKGIEISGFPKDVGSAKELARNTDKHRIKFQDWIVEFMIGGVSNEKKSGDGGYDGYITYSKSRDGKIKGLAIIEVKSGNINVATLRSFINVVEKEKADMGIFVCFADQITQGMLREASQVGREPNFNKPKIQLISVENLLDGNLPDIPGKSSIDVFEKSTMRLDQKVEQPTLNL